jgi:hypothetical protein
MIAGISFIAKAARIKQLFGRGQGWLYIGKDVAMLFVSLYVVEDILNRIGIVTDDWFLYLYPLIPITYILSCIVIGWIDEQRGIWKAECVYGTLDVNPAMKEMYEKVNDIHRVLSGGNH